MVTVQTIAEMKQQIKEEALRLVNDPRSSLREVGLFLKASGLAPNQKKNMAKQYFVNRGFCSPDDDVCFNTRLVASQIPLDAAHTRFVLVVLSDYVIALAYDPIKARRFGTSPHGQASRSDAVRSPLLDFETLEQQPCQ